MNFLKIPLRKFFLKKINLNDLRPAVLILCSGSKQRFYLKCICVCVGGVFDIYLDKHEETIQKYVIRKPLKSLSVGGGGVIRTI